MGHEHDRLAEIGLKPQELVLEPVPGDRVDGAEGLVHEEHLGIGAESPSHTDTLRLSAGELLGIALRELRGVEADHVEQFVDARADLCLRPSQELRDGGDVLRDGPVREQADLLDHVPDAAAQGVGVHVCDVLAAEVDPTPRGLDHPVDQPQRGRLATTGWPDENEHLAGGYVESQFLHGRVG